MHVTARCIWAPKRHRVCNAALQVVREVAVLDNINPGGLYAARVKLLARRAGTHSQSAVWAAPPACQQLEHRCRSTGSAILHLPQSPGSCGT